MTQVTTIQVPPSKSVSHRALIAAAHAHGRSVVKNVLESVDLKITRGCLTAGGVHIEPVDGGYAVIGKPGGLDGGPTRHEPVILEMNESGTSCRLLTAIAAAGQGEFQIRGADRLHERPIGKLVRALEDMGAHITFLGIPDNPPLSIQAEGLLGGEVSVELEESSQYLSALLLAAPLAANETTIEIAGSKVVSWPYVALTLAAMEDFGVPVVVETGGEGNWKVTDWQTLTEVQPGNIRFMIQPGAYNAREYTVEGDWSGASYFIAAGAVAGPLVISGVRRDSAQADKDMLDIVRSMGAEVVWNDAGDAVTVSPGANGLRGVTVDMNRCPDIVPTVAVLASFANGPTTVTNVAHLRIKESDRLEAIASQIEKTGCTTRLTEDSITIEPAPLPDGKAIDFTTFGDHRIPMSLALFELAGIGATFDNPACVSKSFPDFWYTWNTVRHAAGLLP